MKEKTENEIFSFSERVIKEVVKRDDEYTKQIIRDYFTRKYPKENLKFDFLDEEIVNEIIKLGIAEYQRRQASGSVLSEKNSIEEDIERLKLCSSNQCHICGRYEKEECMLERNRCEQHILSAYKRVLKENEVLLKENEELKEKIREHTLLISHYYVKENYIPVQTIKDKIEELNRKIDKSVDDSKGGLDEEFIEKAGELLTQKRILQELLESEE